MHKLPHVALIVETSSVYGRRLLAGINRYVQTHRPWSVFLDQSDLFAKPPAWLTGWRGDGVICRTRRSALELDAARCPVVDLSDIDAPRPNIPRIESDHALIGRRAAEHLLERGFERFAFCGFTGHRWSDLRAAGFADRLRAEGHAIATLRSAWSGRHGRSWDAEQRRLTRWLTRLEKPVGVMATNDLRGQHVLDACARAGLSVPEQVAVVGCDNDELLCGLCRPPLSSVVPDAVRVGETAAAVLDAMMRHESPPTDPLLIPPIDLATRQSSDVLAIDDPLMTEALRLIRQGACFGLRVEGLLDQLGVSRTKLERRFRAHLGRSPHAEIRRAQLKRVKQLLVETDLPLDRIARLGGFDHPEYMSVVFKRIEGITPGAFRQRARDR